MGFWVGFPYPDAFAPVPAASNPRTQPSHTHFWQPLRTTQQLRQWHPPPYFLPARAQQHMPHEIPGAQETAPVYLFVDAFI